MNEHVGEERSERRECELTVRERARERGEIEREASVECVERVRLTDQRQCVDEHSDVGGEEQAVRDRWARGRIDVAQRDQARSSVATTLDPWIVKMVREPSET